MSDKFYKSVRRTATRMIRQYGRPAVLVKRTRSGGTNARPEFTEENLTVHVFTSNVSMRDREGSSTDMLAKEVYVESKHLINSSDRLLIDGVEFPVEQLHPLNPGGTVLLYQARVSA